MASHQVLERQGTDPAAEVGSDAGLVRALVEGSPDALAVLYDRHGGAVYDVAMRLARDPSLAAEVVQETFLVLWNRAELFDPARGTLAGWLLRIARNRTVDHLRAARRGERAASFSSFARQGEDDHATAEWLTAAGELVGAAAPEPGPEHSLAARETRAAIERAVASLDPPERYVIALAYGGGLSQSEIATHLGWPIGTVKTRTRRALHNLRDRLEQPLAGALAPGAQA